MAVTYDHLMGFPVPEARQTVTPDDCILYAISVGIGAEEDDDPRQLRYVYEHDLQALPMMANVLAYPGFWLKESNTGVDWHRVLHGEQALTVHRPLPVDATLVGRTKVVGIRDRGPDRGAWIYTRREVVDEATGEPVCTLEQSALARGDGGCGGDDPSPRERHHVPDRAPDIRCDFKLPLNAALLYRLNGDRNPLHVDPEVAKAAGFHAPILHGMCTMGWAGHAVLRTVLGYDAARFRSMAVRFTAPIHPGETLRTDIWHDGDVVSYRSTALQRKVVVLDDGRVDLD